MPAFIDRLISPKRMEPSYPALPYVDGNGESNVPGIYVVGELAGTPLVKLGLNAGHDLVGNIAPGLLESRGDDEDLHDLVIVGAGSSGLAATVAAQEAGLRSVTIEAAALANTFVTMMKGKLLLAEPENVTNRSSVWFEECRKEELLEKWRAMVAERRLPIREHEKVADIRGKKDDFTVVTDSGRYRARRVALCMGKAGNPRKLGVPGEKENADRIHHRLLDAADFRGQKILIVGGGDVACEAAAALATDGSNEVTLSAIDKEFTFPKKRNIDAVRMLESEGKLEILLGSSVRTIGRESARIETTESETVTREYDQIFEMIGAELPLKFFRKAGIRLANSWTPGRWIALFASFLLVYSFYALKSYGKGAVAWPFQSLIAPETYSAGLGSVFRVLFAPFAPLMSAEALSDIAGDIGYQQGFAYSAIYTIAMIVFGSAAMLRWRRIARDGRYQTYRYICLIGFQVAFFLIVNIIGVHALTVKYAWRAWGLYQPFPLFFNTFFWWYPGDPVFIVRFFVGAGLLGTFVAIPVLARNHGKRFCTWVCGCGGLAETLGDRWRHLAPKGERSRAWEFQAVAVLLASGIVAMVVIGAHGTDGNNIWWRVYNYIVDFWLVAVIPIALYPFFGGKVWCRYWCPLAAYNGLLARWYGRLQITSNSKCINCAECSKYCQVGVDVMAFAKNEAPFDNTNSACIQCGICIDVCPMSVLEFDIRE